MAMTRATRLPAGLDPVPAARAADPGTLHIVAIHACANPVAAPPFPLVSSPHPVTANPDESSARRHPRLAVGRRRRVDHDRDTGLRLARGENGERHRQPQTDDDVPQPSHARALLAHKQEAFLSRIWFRRSPDIVQRSGPQVASSSGGQRTRVRDPEQTVGTAAVQRAAVLRRRVPPVGPKRRALPLLHRDTSSAPHRLN
jgi:hypothetical protein